MQFHALGSFAVVEQSERRFPPLRSVPSLDVQYSTTQNGSKVAPTFLLTHRSDFGPWYSYAGILILLPLFATFVLYGPVLLVHQIIRSGSRGRFVARMFLAILLVAALLFGGLFLSGLYTESRARILAFVFTAGHDVFELEVREMIYAPNTAGGSRSSNRG